MHQKRNIENEEEEQQQQQRLSAERWEAYNSDQMNRFEWKEWLANS